MKRPLFCELCPFAFRLSRLKGIMLRKLKDAFSPCRFSRTRSTEALPIVIMKHSSLIRRKLAGVSPQLQDNKTTNMSLAAPCLNGILIRPGETFSLWRLLGNTSARKGYLPGLVIKCGKATEGEGGGMCQLSNLLHWMALHSELSITEHHHHERFNLFPDDDRRVPFGLGTSIVYNYLDYRLTNNTERTYQILLNTDGELLYGELRADTAEPARYAIRVENDRFVRADDGIRRRGDVYRDTLSADGSRQKTEHLLSTDALVMYEVEEKHISPN